MRIVTGILFSFPADWRRQILKIVLVLDCNWLLWAVTLAVFFGWRQIFLALKHPLLHPILWATLVVVLLLALSRYPVTAYRERSAPLVWLLGPAVAAMAVPIWQRRKLIVSNWRALLLVV